jgi:membrane-associated phospholipid phosphatase
MYRGMHHVTDVGAGAVMGLGALAILVFVARASRAAAQTRDRNKPNTAAEGRT